MRLIKLFEWLGSLIQKEGPLKINSYPRVLYNSINIPRSALYASLIKPANSSAFFWICFWSSQKCPPKYNYIYTTIRAFLLTRGVFETVLMNFKCFCILDRKSPEIWNIIRIKASLRIHSIHHAVVPEVF